MCVSDFEYMTICGGYEVYMERRYVVCHILVYEGLCGEYPCDMCV